MPHVAGATPRRRSATLPNTMPTLLLTLITAAAVGIGVAVRRTTRQQETQAMTATLFDRLSLDLDIPWRLRRWASAVAVAAARTRASTGLDESQLSTDTWARILIGKLDRESYGGMTLKPTDATGTGDWTPRLLSRVQSQTPALISSVVIVGLDDKGRQIVMPSDQLGWGRGLAQIDWMFHEFARTGDWRDANESIAYGAALLASEVARFAAMPGHQRSYLSPVRLGLDAYNAGNAAVRRAIAAGVSPESVTTGGDYAVDVLRRATQSGGLATNAAAGVAPELRVA